MEQQTWTLADLERELERFERELKAAGLRRNTHPLRQERLDVTTVWHAHHMPKLPTPVIEVAWRHSGETGKIHYRARRPDGSTRHLISREGQGLYEVLDAHLAQIGYTGPKAGTSGEPE